MKRQKLAVEPAVAADAPALTRLVRESAAYRGDYHVMVANLTITTSYIARNPVRVVRDQGDRAVIGFVSLIIPGMGADGEGEIDFMFVADGWQGRGIGRLLVEDVTTVASRHRLERLHIVAHPPAESFYRSCGATLVGHVPPTGRVTWTRPHLALTLPGPRPDGEPTVRA